MKDLQHVGEHLASDSGINAYPEEVVHYEIGILERTHHAVADVLIGRLAQQVSGKQESRSDLVLFEIAGYLIAAERRIRAYGERETEPARVGVRRSFGQNEKFFEIAQAFLQARKVGPPRLYEPGQLLQLRHADRRLHVGHFEVVADMRVDVLVIVTAGETAELPLESFAAGVLFAGIAPAVSPAVTITSTST